MGDTARGHSDLASAFARIEDKNALAWAVLDSKSEKVVTSAIALAANRRAGRRVAVPELKHMDLVFLRGGGGAFTERIGTAYQAKAAYLCDFTEARIRRRHPYVGSILNTDFPKLRRYCTEYQVERSAGVFYLFEVSDPTKQIKYGTTRHVAIREALGVIVGEVAGNLVFSSVIDCGEADGSTVKIHMLVFEPFGP